MELVRDVYEANCITHSGTMHTDDIFSTAFLDLYLGNIKVQTCYTAIFLSAASFSDIIVINI